MKKVLIHLHLYYHEQLSYFLEKLKNVCNCEWDLVITTCEQDVESEQKILQFKPEAQIILVDNCGYDILPFLKVIESVNLDDYDFVLKLHAKKLGTNTIKFKGITFQRSFWRNRLVDSLLYSKDVFNQNLAILTQENYGMIVDTFFYMKLIGMPEDTFLLNDLKNKLDIKSEHQYFLAGTMFFIKASILKRLLNYNFLDNELNHNWKATNHGTIFHAYERVFTILTVDEGYKIYQVPMF